MNKLSLGIISVVLAVSVATLALQERRNQQLRELVAQQSATLKDPVSPALVAGPNASDEHAELLRLRAQVASLKNSGGNADVLRKPNRGNVKKASIAPGLTAIDALGDQGLTTPRAALATQLWAAHGGAIDLEAKSIVLGPVAREKLETLASSLPAPIRAQYDTPEKLMAYLLAGSPHPVGGMQVLNENQEDADNTILDVRWQHEDSEEVNENKIHMRQSGNGWQMVVSAGLVERASSYLKE